MKFAINNRSYSYELYGSGAPLVLLHGFTGSTLTWHPLLNYLKSSFKLILIDLPGHGKTDTKSACTMEMFCEDLKGFLTHLGLESVHLLGYSMGGRTALSFAMMYPEMVRSLILESASPGLKTENARLERRKKDDILANRIINEGITQFVDHWESLPLFETQRQLPQEIRQTIREERLMQSPEGLAHSLRYMGTGSQPSWWHHLNELKLPIQLLVGQLDEKFIFINQEMDKLFPNSDLKIISEAGHAIHVEQPEIFGKMIEGFIVKQQSNL